MRASFRSALLAASLLLASCSDDPTQPSGSLADLPYNTSVDLSSDFTRSLWGTSNGEMYASGSTILKYDGFEWRPIELPPLDRGFSRTWGTSNGDVYAIGNNRIHRYDGSQWHEIQRPAYVNDVWGSDDGHIFVVGGGNNRLYHYDGANWSVDSLIVTSGQWVQQWNYVSGGSSSDVYIGGWSGWLGHYDGSGWTAMRPDTTRSWSSIWKAPNGPLYMASYDTLFTFDGQDLRPVDVGERVWDPRISGHSTTEVYCAASNGRIFSFDGSRWDLLADINSSVDVVWGERASGRMFAAGRGVIWKIEGSSAAMSFGTPESRFQIFYDLWGSDTDGIFLIGTHAYRYLNGAWTDLKKQDLVTHPARSIWGRSGHELYAVGENIILHFDGQQWTWVSGGGDKWLYAVTGTDRVVYAVGAYGTILQLRDGRWSPMSSGTSYDLFAVHAWEDRAFAGGDDGAMMHYDGREWRPFPSPVSWDIYDMFGFGDDIYAVGADQTEICHFDGGAWKPIFIEYAPGYNASIWGTSERNIFIGKSDGYVLHFDGSEWSSLPRVTSLPVNSVWGTSSGEIITASERSIVRYTR